MIPANQKYCHDHVNQDKNPIKLAPIPIPAAVKKPDPASLMRSMFDRTLFTRLPVITGEEPFEIFAVVPEETIPLNIPAEEFITTYIPSVTYLTVPNENGLEQKYGGRVPFFVEGDTWPHAQRPNGKVEPMVFVAQFIDPRSDKNELTQIFMPNPDDIDLSQERAYIRKINLDQPLRQIRIESPIRKNLAQPPQTPGFFSEWIVEKEAPYSVVEKYARAALAAFPDLSKEERDQSIRDTIDDYNELVTPIFKVGGVGFSANGNDYIRDYNNILEGTWKNVDYLHLGADGYFDADQV